MNKEVALIKFDSVLNVIIADDSFIEHISNEYDHVIDVTGMSPRPGLGWSYVDGEFFVPGQYENGEFLFDETIDVLALIEEPPA